jgi:hypothetical protein
MSNTEIKKKVFVVSFASDGGTRWVYDDNQLADMIRHLASSAAALSTNGKLPDAICHPFRGMNVACPHCTTQFAVHDRDVK